MKKIIALILAVISCLLLASCGGNMEVPEGMKLASNTAIVDYSLFVPENWIVDLSDARTAAHVSDSDRTSINIAQWNYQGTVDDWWKNEYKEQNFASEQPIQ